MLGSTVLIPFLLVPAMVRTAAGCQALLPQFNLQYRSCVKSDSFRQNRMAALCRVS